MRKLANDLEGFAIGTQGTLLRDAVSGAECFVPVAMESKPRGKGRSYTLPILDWVEVEDGISAAQVANNKGAIVRTEKSLTYVSGLQVRSI
jgi:hypothetical protein